MIAPVVTVLLPVFNGGGLFRASLESILRQSLTSIEVLVIDDGSTDETPAFLSMLRDPRVRVLTNERNLGLTCSLNRGLMEACGALIARQDADDLSRPARLERQLQFLRANSDVALLGTSAWRLDPTGRVAGANDLPTSHDAIRWASVTDNPFLHTSVMFRRDIIQSEFGGYNERFPICQDYELWNRVAARHPVANLRARLVCMREHAASMTHMQPAATTAEIREILAANWSRLFPGRQLSASEGDLLASFRLRFSVEQLAPLRELLGELLKEFLAGHPRAGNTADFRATLCRQSLRIAYKQAEAAPRRALEEVVSAFRHSPPEWCRQGWTWLRTSRAAT